MRSDVVHHQSVVLRVIAWLYNIFHFLNKMKLILTLFAIFGLVSTATSQRGKAKDPPCLPTLCEEKGTTCKNAWGFDIVKQNVDAVTSHHCWLPDGSDGESYYCCDHGSEEGEIIERLSVLPNEFPTQAFLSSKYLVGNGGNCGGTVYNRNWIITAAHCVTKHTYKDQKATKVTIKLAANHVNQLGRMDPDKVYTSSGKNIIIHKKYNKKNTEQILWDVALLKLDSPIKDSVWGSYVKAMRIAEEGEEPMGDRAIAIGYGKSDLNVSLGALMGGPLPLSLPDNYQECRELANKGEYSNQNICVGGKGYGSVSSGDSGGPAICLDSDKKPYLCGIASYVNQNCVTQLDGKCPIITPGVFVKVATFSKWFTDHIKEAQDEDSLVTKLKRDMYTGKWIKGKPSRRGQKDLVGRGRR